MQNVAWIGNKFGSIDNVTNLNVAEFDTVGVFKIFLVLMIKADMLDELNKVTN